MDNISFDFEVVSHSLELLSFRLACQDYTCVHQAPDFILFVCLFERQRFQSVAQPGFRLSAMSPSQVSQTAGVPLKSRVRQLVCPKSPARLEATVAPGVERGLRVTVPALLGRLMCLVQKELQSGPSLTPETSILPSNSCARQDAQTSPELHQPDPDTGKPVFICAHNGHRKCHHRKAESPVSIQRGLRHPGPGQVSPHPRYSRHLLARHFPSMESHLDILLPRFFRRLDKDGSRSLDAEELRQGLGQLGLDVGEAEAEALCKRWDRDGSGTLDLEEFLQALQPPMSQAREAVIAAAFAKLDQTGDGVVTVDDLRGVYSGRAHPKVRSGEWTEDEALHQFLDNFDTFEKDGQVTLAEFQDYYRGLSASVDTDSEFVAMVSNAWRL
uniref:calcyphosin isoform X2 n=1 Tax=Myodes glareolus TaxID=447135 RepID=UPI00202057E5|nr:calcyphosin isoform X2 [Myodes glareolus]